MYLCNIFDLLAKMLKLTLCVLLISYCVVANYDKNPEEGELFEGDIAGVK